MPSLSTHVLDTSTGNPVSGLRVSLAQGSGDTWSEVSHGRTDEDGRVLALATRLDAGAYRLRFETGAHNDGFYPFVDVIVRIDSDREHYHIPLLLSPYGYTTYRGS